jgi:NAD(P)-dependent dehydrogenase (short-subunit alcohol dehydrogenase family)
VTAPVDFTGRVAVVTGAGRGLGRDFALLLAARGAKVVVNDVGVLSDADGSGADPTRAEAVVAEIVAAGGEAVAEASSVASDDGAQSIVRRACDAFGRLDIVINNAGLLGVEATVAETTHEHFQRLLDVNLLGPAAVSRAAWPLMEEQAFGRIVNITSGSIFGFATEVAYSASKAGQWGLTRALAEAGRPTGILVNAVMPHAYTAMSEHAMSQSNSPVAGPKNNWLGEWMRTVAKSSLCAPLVCWLAHDDCRATGELFATGSGRIARAVLADTPGVVVPEITLEDVRDRFDEVMSDTRYEVHAGGPDRSRFHHDVVESARAGTALSS